MRKLNVSNGFQAVSLPVVLALAGCAEASAQPPYIGSVYAGRVKAEIDMSDLPITRLRYGDATAEFKRTTAGKALLTLTGSIRDKGDAGFAIEGSYGKSGFRGSGPSIELTIDPAGKISGGGVDNGAEYRFSGTVSGPEMALTVHYRPTAEAQPSTLRGIEFTYALENETEEKSSEKAGKRCREIRYEMRPVANMGEGTMSMMSVPVCLE
jgi:hypothetical protein